MLLCDIHIWYNGEVCGMQCVYWQSVWGVWYRGYVCYMVCVSACNVCTSVLVAIFSELKHSILKESFKTRQVLKTRESLKGGSLGLCK